MNCMSEFNLCDSKMNVDENYADIEVPTHHVCELTEILVFISLCHIPILIPQKGRK